MMDANPNPETTLEELKNNSGINFWAPLLVSAALLAILAA
jgi:hypothetical protein